MALRLLLLTRGRGARNISTKWERRYVKTLTNPSEDPVRHHNLASLEAALLHPAGRHTLNYSVHTQPQILLRFSVCAGLSTLGELAGWFSMIYTPGARSVSSARS
jgi:hypothetical protein